MIAQTDGQRDSYDPPFKLCLREYNETFKNIHLFKLTNKEGIYLQLKGQFKDALQFNTVSYKTKRLNTILY